MEYSNLPAELTEEILLAQDDKNLIFHCNINKNTYDICNNVYFWTKYVKNKKKYELETLILSLIRKSQSFIQPLYEAVSKKYTINNEVMEVLIFYSRMRGDKKFLEFLNVDFDLNTNNILVRAITDLIDEINSNNSKIDIIENKLDILQGTLLFRAYGIPFHITGAILDKCKMESIKNLPSMVDDDIAPYDHFCLSVAKTLSYNSNIGDLIYLMNKFYYNDIILEEFYIAIAEYLPTDLYSYVQPKLPEKVNLVSKIGHIRDLDHARYIMKQVGYPKKLSQYMTFGDYMAPSEFVNYIKPYKATIKFIGKLHNRLMQLYGKINNPWIWEVKKMLNI